MTEDEQVEAYQKVKALADELGVALPRTSDAKLSVLDDVLELLIEHPPIHVRGGNQSFSGEHDCKVCGYPLTGNVKDGMPSHDDYVENDFGFPRPCAYRKAIRNLRQLIEHERSTSILDQLAEEAS